MEVTPASVTDSGSKGPKTVMHTVEVPVGETWLIAVIGNMVSSHGSQGNWPALFIGGSVSGGFNTGAAAFAHIGTGTVTIGLYRNYALGTDSFTGHMYAVKI